MTHGGKATRTAVALLIALGVNTTLFCCLPLLSQPKHLPTPPEYSNPFLLAKAPPLEEKKQPRKVKRLEETKPRETPKAALPKQMKTTMQKPQVTPPDIAFAPAPPLAGGMRIDPSMLAAAPSAAMTGLKGFELGEVDTPPRPIHRVQPVYPYAARRKGLTGKVIIRFLVDKDGRVRQPMVIEATPRGVFDKSVLDAIRRWRFKPGMYEGAPVPTWVEAPLKFDLDS